VVVVKSVPARIATFVKKPDCDLGTDSVAGSVCSPQLPAFITNVTSYMPVSSLMAH
jgi:hypothetical protein